MKCSICGEERKIMYPGDKGHNPEPIKKFSDGTCCNDCEYQFVIPARGIPYETSMEIKKIDDKYREKMLNEYANKVQR